MTNNKGLTTIKLKIDLIVDDNEIDDIVASAFEGGIMSQWCTKVEVVGDYLGDYASEQISRGGELLIYVAKEKYVLSKDKLLKAFQLYVTNPHPYDFLEERDNKLHIDMNYVDAVVADMLIQYAIFGKIIYG